MKKGSSLLFAAVCLFFVVGCSSLPKELNKQNFAVTPSVLEVVNGKIEATLSATFPENYMPSKAIITVVPVLQYSGKELIGAETTYQGSKVIGNNKVISAAGGSYSQPVSFNFNEEMRKATLVARVSVSMGNKVNTFPDVWLADGTLATVTLATPKTAELALGKDKFQRIIEEKQEADIKFLMQQADIRKTELNKSELQTLIYSAISAQKELNKEVRSLDISAYASPDGGYKLNEKLAGKRGNNTQKQIENILKKNDAEKATINVDETPEDWEGFKALMEKSTIEDKDLILRVLSMHSDPEEREHEIKNLSTAFKEVKEQILPQLRRSKLALNVEVIGKSDVDISNLAKTDPSKLNVEELLYAASLSTDAGERTAIYEKTESFFPNDWRGFNNYGVEMFKKGDFSSAAMSFKQANNLNSGIPEVQNNLAVLALMDGKLDQAEILLGKAGGVPETTTNMALLNLMRGNSTQAVTQYSEDHSNNAVVARIMAKDYNGATQLLSKQSSSDAVSYYLAAIVGARTNNVSAITSNLSKAYAADPKYKALAQEDVEFSKFPDATK